MREKQQPERNNSSNSYEKKMRDAFMAHIGRCYEEQLFREQPDSAKSTPESLDIWFQEFCRDNRSGEDVIFNKDIMEGADAEAANTQGNENIVQEQDYKNNTEYRVLAAYVELMNHKFRKQQEKRRRNRKAAAFIILFLGMAAGATVTAKAFRFDPWKTFVRDEGTDVIISREESADERNYYLSSDWTGYYYPSYIPDGYELQEEKMVTLGGRLDFQKGTSKIIFYCMASRSVVAMDKEHSEYKVLEVGDWTCHFSLNPEQSIVVLFIEENTITIFYNDISMDEICEIIKKIKIFQ